VTVANTTGTLQVSLTTPAPGSTVSGTVWVNVWVNGAAAGTKTYTLTVGTATVWTESATATHVTLPWTTTSTPNGPRTLVATVRDAGGSSGSGSVGVTVQNGASPLAAAFTAPASGATVSNTVSVGMSASGGAGPYTYRLAVDGTQVFTTSGGGSASFAWNTTTVGDGSHTLGLTVTDAGGGSAGATRAVTVSNGTGGGSFQVFLTSPSPGSTVSGTVWVNIWLEGAAAGTRAFTLTVGGSTVWTESSTSNHVALPWTTTSTPNGSRTLVVTVRDPTGATGTASVTVTVQNP
jgi:hypothetical protein